LLILACDTSGPALSTALWQDGSLLAEMTFKTARPHSTTLQPLMEDLLRQCSRTIREVDAFACAVGPGSFTGIRIGVSTIKAMAYAADKPAVGVSTLEAMAWPYVHCRCQVTCPIMDARSQRIYASAWMDGRELLEEANWQANDFLSAMQALAGSLKAEGLVPTFLVTGYWPAVFTCAVSGVGKRILMAPACNSLPRAASLAEIAECRLAAGAIGTPQELMPRYLSLSQAERRLAADHA
jgi:tRNA threonylcarbamoyladenosine biosynthesis protein TsaB